MTSLNRILKNRPVLFAAVLFLVSLLWVITGEKPDAKLLESAAKLKESGEKADIGQSVIIGLHYASIICLVLSAALLATMRWWSRPLNFEMTPPPVDRRIPARYFWIAIAAAMLTGGALRLHLAKGSLWWDELWNIKQTMVGYSKPSAKLDGKLKFYPVKWQRTLWNYRKPTNHPPMAVASRLSNEAWRKTTGSEPGSFSEVAIRTPSLLAGLGSIALVGMMLRRWGFATAGIVAAFLLAVHPWHLRYGVEARAYSLIMFFTALGCYALVRALQSGRWRDWSLFGLAQFFLMWSLPISIWYAAAFAVAALAGTLLNKENRWVLTGRFAVVNVVAGMAFCAVFMPNVIQFLSWGEVNDHQFLSWGLLERAMHQMCFGMQYSWPTNVDSNGLVGLADRPVIVYWLALIFIAGGLLVGIWRLIQKRQRMVLLTFAMLLLSGAGYLWVTYKSEHHFYERYLIYMAVPWVALLAIGLTRLLPRLIAVPVFFVLYLIVVTPQLNVLRSRSYEPFKEVADYVRSQPDSNKANAVWYGLGGTVFPGYHREAKFADNLKQLQSYVDAEAPLYVLYGYSDLERITPGTKTGFALLDDKSLFEEVAAFSGIDSMFYLRVLKRL